MDVGLGYIQMGQSATTLSGGEAQRVKLALELAKPGTGKTVYIMDEPTTGLHVDDVHKLVKVIDRLVEAGNTVIIIEHNLDVIKRADHIIDLGPEGGNAGGMIVAQGTPEEVALCEASYTGQYLRPMLPRPESGAAAPVEKNGHGAKRRNDTAGVPDIKMRTGRAGRARPVLRLKTDVIPRSRSGGSPLR